MMVKGSLLENAILRALEWSSSPFVSDALRRGWLVLLCIGVRSIGIGRREKGKLKVSWSVWCCSCIERTPAEVLYNGTWCINNDHIGRCLGYGTLWCFTPVGAVIAVMAIVEAGSRSLPCRFRVLKETEGG